MELTWRFCQSGDMHDLMQWLGEGDADAFRGWWLPNIAAL